ncbi:hypothetical protein RRF57_012684 [Xylaria bambusicola]|uniref:Utp8 beta-propeller domain-containing protein n=1 Tax=Xylaria bambusicola TaxID=326684 RepID=A0AAN7UVL3_9PEZI
MPTMASQFHIQKPYVLTTLPRPLDPATGAYVVGDVYGLALASKKRKRRRPEVTVAIDGEAINIYDVSSSRLVTSYPIPPQSRFSCPASSIRLKSDTTKDVSRYTYAALNESRTNKVTLFKDNVGESGKTDQSNCSVSLHEGHPVVWLAPLSKPGAVNDATEASSNSELLVVRADGEIIGLDEENLQQKWASSALAMLQDLSEDARTDFTIEFCRSVSASEVRKGILKGDGDIFSLLSDSSQELDEEMEVLVLVSVSGSATQRSRHLHIVGRLPSTNSLQKNRGIVQLHVMPLVPPKSKKRSPRSYRLDARNGALLELQKHTITIHDLTASIPKVASTMQLEGTNSFLPLSKTSLLCSTNTQLSVFNPVYRSLQNTIDIDLESQGQTLTGKEGGSVSCQLVAYFSSLERAVSIVGSNLVAIQLEAPKNRHAKRRAEGLLIDSIGRGLPTTKRSSMPSSKLPPKDSVFSNYLPGSIRGDYWKEWTAGQEYADSLLNSNDIPKFEIFLSEKLGIKVETAPVQSEDSTDVSGKNNLLWRFPKSRANYPAVDRRWILFAISRSFQWNNALLTPKQHLELSSRCRAFNVVELASRLPRQTSEKEAADNFLAEELVSRLAEIDPSLELLVVYLSATKLGALEILLVLRTLMRSLGLINDPNKPLPKLLTNGTTEDATTENDTHENENIGIELDDLEDEIQKTVSYLNNEDAGIRGRGISAAFTKLGVCPHSSAVKALRSTFKPQEILSLMYVLRIELVKGGWTDRYLEAEYRENEGAPFDAPPDGIIKLIADLLGFCLDSLGPGGWLLNDAMQAGDDAADFVGSLTHEVSAALEGLEEMTFLRNFLAGPVKYCEEVSRKAATTIVSATSDANAKPIAINVKDPAARTLPLGLKPASQQASSYKVGSGGEIVQRSLRERGHLISQKVGSYSLERIVI